MLTREGIKALGLKGSIEETKTFLDAVLEADPGTGTAFPVRARSAAILCRTVATLLDGVANLSEKKPGDGNA